jgi:hypothetical protein
MVCAFVCVCACLCVYMYIYVYLYMHVGCIRMWAVYACGLYMHVGCICIMGACASQEHIHVLHMSMIIHFIIGNLIRGLNSALRRHNNSTNACTGIHASTVACPPKKTPTRKVSGTPKYRLDTRSVFVCPQSQAYVCTLRMCRVGQNHIYIYTVYIR